VIIGAGRGIARQVALDVSDEGARGLPVGELRLR
jgi:hypothetical protein